jgi:hypothetical protein
MICATCSLSVRLVESANVAKVASAHYHNFSEVEEYFTSLPESPSVLE